jgi:hypothetical protein
MNAFPTYALPHTQPIAGAAQTYLITSSLNDVTDQIRSGIGELSENFSRLAATARQAQTQIADAARQIVLSVDSLRARQASLASPVPAAGSIDDWTPASGDQQLYGSLKHLTRETLEASKVELDDKMRIADAEYRHQLQLVELEQKLGKLSAAQAIAQEQQLLRQKWMLTEQFFAAKKQAASGDAAAQQQIDQGEAVTYLRYLAQQEELTETAAARFRQCWEDAVKPIADQLAAFATEVIMRTKSIAKAFDEMLRSITEDFLRSSLKDFFTSLFGGDSGTADSGGGLGVAGGLLGDMFKSIVGGIGKGAGSAIDSAIGNPFEAGAGGLIGGSLAGLFGGIGTSIGNTATDFSSAAGGALGFGGLLGKMASALPGASGGWVVPAFDNGGILSVLHRNEMVLPANISQGLQSMITGGGTGGHTFNINAVDANSVARLFRNNGAAIVAAMNNAMRNGSVLKPAT